MKSRDTKKLVLFAGGSATAVVVALVMAGGLFTGEPAQEPENNPAQASSASQPWDAPAQPCAEPEVREEAVALRDAATESPANSTLAHPDDVSEQERSTQELAWNSLSPQELAVQHCLATLGADG